MQIKKAELCAQFFYLQNLCGSCFKPMWVGFFIVAV